MGENAERKRSFLGHIIGIFLNQIHTLATTKLTRQNPIFYRVVNTEGMQKNDLEHAGVFYINLSDTLYVFCQRNINELSHNISSSPHKFTQSYILQFLHFAHYNSTWQN